MIFKCSKITITQFYVSIQIRQQIYFIEGMSTNPPNSLVDWIKQFGLQDQFSAQQIESGRSVGRIMKIIVPEYNLQLLASNSAVNRVSNWNNLITQLKKLGIRVSQDQKTKIINGNHDIVYQILVRLHDHYTKSQKQTEVDISKINGKSEINESTSLLELFILTIMKYFNLSAKESVALLSSQCKYLAHILVKGLKGQFKPIQGFMNQLVKHIQLINAFCKNKENQIFFIRAIKPSLISKSDSASQRGLQLLQQFLNPLPHKYDIIKEHFISTLILSIRRHPHLLNEIVKFSIVSTNFSKDLLFLYKSEATQVEIQNIFLSMLNQSKQTKQSKQFFQLKGINEIVNKSIQNLKSAQSATSSMNMLLLLSEDNTQLLSDPDRGSKFIEYIQQVSITKKTSSIVFIQQLFAMLELFGKDKNQLAPAIFKILILKYQASINGEQSQVFIQNFQQILQEFPTIPFSMILDAVNSKMEANTLNISQIEISLFKDIIQNQSIDVKSALVIYNIISKLIVQDPAYVKIGTELLLNIIRKFISQSIVTDLTIKLIKICLAIHYANVKRIGSKRRSVTGSTKIQPQEALPRSKNFALEQLIYRIVELQFKQINKSAEPLVAYSLIQVQILIKENAFGLRKIIELFGDPNTIIKKYEAEAKKLEQQENRKEEKKSKLKQSAWATKNRYQSPSQPQSREKGISHLSSDEVLKNTKLKTKLDPMLLSHVGVTPAAMRGLQKYQKSYITKVEKLEQQQKKKKQEEDRQTELKKIFQRKMLQNGVQVKKIKDQQFKYIYQFGVKQKQIQHDTAKVLLDVPFYNQDDDEERDMKGLQYALKRYQKIFKLYYNIYSGHTKPQNLDSFDQIAQKVNLLYSNNLWKMFRDHTLDDFINVKQVQFLSKKVNYNLNKDFDDATALDYEGFENFMIQASICMFSRPPKDLRGHPISQMIQETISRLKLYASQNRVNEKLFEDPDNVFFNQTQAVKELNRKLQINPDYILPEGYKKITEKKVIFTHRIFLDAMSTSYKDVYEIIDQLLNKTLGVHVIEPFTTYETIAKARPTLYFKSRPEGEIYSQKLSAFIKKEVAKMPIKDREIGKQVAGVLDEIVQAVQFGNDRLGLRYENKVIKQKKMIQQEQSKKEQQEKRKWADRDRQIKSALIKHKEVQTEKQKEEQEKRQQEKRRIEQDKRKRQQQEQRLKKKVESYQAKKKQDQQRRKKQADQLKRKQKEELQRKNKANQETLKAIKQKKQKKEQQEQQKKKLEELAEKERKAQEKRKLQEEQKRKRQLIEEYKQRKSETMNQSQVSQSPQNQSSIKVLDSSRLGSSIQRKKLI